ncbi:MAG: hypothetical protein JW818_00155 [Pirellulales bacterium]|nr:hypothetical protein [Pirellulales bacterium]
MRPTVLCLAILVGWGVEAFGNAGIFSGSGHTVQLIKSNDVQMVTEDVLMRPICGASSMAHSVDVRCKFVLKNKSGKKVAIQVGFPLDSQWHHMNKSKLAEDTTEVLKYHFIARDENDTYHVRYVVRDEDNKFTHLFLWDMLFTPGETKTLHVGYIMPVSVSAFTTRKFDEKNPVPPRYKKPWHHRLDGAMLLHFSYVTETGNSWAGPIEKAVFRLDNSAFEYNLQRRPEYIGGHPADDVSETETPDADMPSADGDPIGPDYVYGMKLGALFFQASPKGGRPAHIPELPPDSPSRQPPNGIIWEYKNYKPGEPLGFSCLLLGYPETPSDCGPWVRGVLGKNPSKVDLRELREILAAFYGVPPTTPSVKRFVSQQVWFKPKSKRTEAQLPKLRRAVLNRLDELAEKAERESKKDSRPGAKTQRVV